jgi:hypothetical protein
MNKRYGMLTCTIFIVMIALLSNCDKKVGKVPVTTAPTTPTVGQCDSITFAKHIKPIINSNCAIPGCHTAGYVNGDFTTYAGLETKVTSGKFKLRVFDSPGDPMPASGMLPQSQLNIIKCWLDKGHPNN